MFLFYEHSSHYKGELKSSCLWVKENTGGSINYDSIQHMPLSDSHTYCSELLVLDLAPSDYNLLPQLKKHLKRMKFHSDSAVIATTETWLEAKPSEFFFFFPPGSRKPEGPLQ